jgi:hypothetical protein
VRLGEFHVDRGYLASALVRDRAEDLAVFCKAFPVRAPGGRFAKPAFTIDFDARYLGVRKNLFDLSGGVPSPGRSGGSANL